MKEIAAILELSEKTVEFHKHHIMEHSVSRAMPLWCCSP